MARCLVFRLVIFPVLLCTLVLSRAEVIRMPAMRSSFDGEEMVGTRWAILVAGSLGYGNYRHQADVCHAYQILRKGGLKEENIVVFMYDDLADNHLNPRPDVIINHPEGHDVYAGSLSERHNLKLETIVKQYQIVKERTLNSKIYNAGSHVMEYETKSIKAEKLYLYQGFDPSNANVSDDNLPQTIMASEVINQIDADLHFMWKMYKQLDDNSKKKTEILEEIIATTKHRLHLDSSVDFIGKLLFGSTAGPSILGNIRSFGQPLVDDLDCLKSMVRVFESHCGSLTQYGMKHMRAFANICNEEISMEAMEGACISACGGYNSTKWGPLSHGYSA